MAHFNKAPVTRYRITLVPDYFSHRLGVPVTRDHDNPIRAIVGKSFRFGCDILKSIQHVPVAVSVTG